jgi:apolipoprotein N-acyltransferase
VLHWVWKTGFDWTKIKTGIFTYGTTLLLLLVFGGLRLALFPPESSTVRVASITGTNKNLSRKKTPSPPDKASLRKEMARIQEGLIQRSREAAEAGASIILWQEGAAPLFKGEEEYLYEKAAELARTKNVSLLMALSARPGNFPKELIENKVVLIDSNGEINFEYKKAKPVPGERVVRGDGKVPVHDTPFGRVAAVICFDMDFPTLIRQAGNAAADILLVPARDWKAIDPMHTRMAVFRAVENGFSMVRSTGKGLSIAVDYQGRVLSAMDSFTSRHRIMISDIPRAGVSTIYSVIGDLFAWLSIAGFIVILFHAAARKRA